MIEPLTWDDSYSLALALKEAHPETNLEDLSLKTIYQWVIALPNFADDAAMANDDILMDIFREWLECASGS